MPHKISLIILAILGVFALSVLSFFFVSQSSIKSTITENECAIPDFDQDGVNSITCGGNDCRDDDPLANPNGFELCDGKDNTCDGRIDEGYDEDGDGFTVCGGDCRDDDRTINPGAAEICDGKDNNCDGTVDENCGGCTSGTTRKCGNTDVGFCSYGTQTCSNGSWGSCKGYIGPKAEICGNGIDEDCNGVDKSCGGYDNNPPLAPSNLYLSNVSSSRITLNWTDNASNETGFLVQRKIGETGTFSDLVVISQPDAVAYNDLTVVQNAYYAYRVKAYNSYGSSVFSNEVSAVTSDDYSPTPTPTYSPNPTPTGDSNSYCGDYICDPGEEAYCYNDCGSPNPTPTPTYSPNPTPTPEPGGTECSDWSDNDGDGKVDFLGGQNGEPADPGCADQNDNNEDATPTAPSNLTSSVGELVDGSPRVTLNWFDNATNETAYVVQRKILGDINFNEHKTIAANSTAYNDTDQLMRQTTYVYRIKAVGNDGVSFSNESSVYIPTLPECRDGIDNDHDGATDFGFDFSCFGLNDNDEGDPLSQCQDGQDNDGDGKIDYGTSLSNDPDCTSLQDNTEAGPSPSPSPTPTSSPSSLPTPSPSSFPTPSPSPSPSSSASPSPSPTPLGSPSNQPPPLGEIDLNWQKTLTNIQSPSNYICKI